VAELYEEALFKEHPPNEECPICFLTLPCTSQTIFKSCCGKTICNGCIYAMMVSEGGGYLCPFCRMPPLPPNSDEEKRKRKNREKSARYYQKHKKKTSDYSDKELDNRREKGRLRQRKYEAKRKAQKQQAEAAASKLGLNNSGGGDGVIKNGQWDVDTNIDVDEDAG